MTNQEGPQNTSSNEEQKGIDDVEKTEGGHQNENGQDQENTEDELLTEEEKKKQEEFKVEDQEAEAKKEEQEKNDLEAQESGAGRPTTKEEIETLDSEIGELDRQIEKLTDDVEKQNKLKEAGFPPIESVEAKRIEELEARKEVLEKEKEALEDKQERVETEKEKILQEKIDRWFEEFTKSQHDLHSEGFKYVWEEQKGPQGNNEQNSLDPETQKSLNEAFQRGRKTFAEILKMVPKLLEMLKKFDDDLEKEATENVEKEMEEEKRQRKEEEKRREEEAEEAKIKEAEKKKEDASKDREGVGSNNQEGRGSGKEKEESGLETPEFEENADEKQGADIESGGGAETATAEE